MALNSPGAQTEEGSAGIFSSHVNRSFVPSALLFGLAPQAARALDLSPSTLYRKREAWAKQA